MKQVLYTEVLEAFGNPIHEFDVEAVNEGLINHSFKLTSRHNGNSFLLQQINSHVFPAPAQLQENYALLWKHLQEDEHFYTIAEPKYFPGEQLIFRDSTGRSWRVFKFMEGGETHAVAQTISQAKAVAETFAGFTASFSDLDVSRLHITIPGFHDLSLRFKQFEKSLHSGQFERLQQSVELVHALKQRERYASFYDVISGSDEFPLRVMHHDAKISNVLFDKETGKVICPVDLDTAMPGYFFSDLGDMIRSMACCKDENSIEFEELCIRKDFYEAILSGYVDRIEKLLTASEKKYIHYAGLLIIYMQALRFLTDYLHGDIYYKTSYPDQNFNRAKNQLTLLIRLEEFLAKEYKLRA